MHVQFGKGSYTPSLASTNDFDIQYFRVKDSLKDEIQGASLVISHAGAGSILETLTAHRPLIVVPNELLMNNHQVQLAEALANEKFLLCSTLQHLRLNVTRLLDQVENDTFTLFPQEEAKTFQQQINELTE